MNDTTPTTLTLTFISLLCFYFIFYFTPLLYIFISCFFDIPLFYFTYYTPFNCGVTDGG